jgi:YbgC/YbaW family acyl-CoA thioester hydrolase
MQRQDFRFFHRLRVRWAEVDLQKIVFNAHYLMYLDTALTDYWRALALPYEESLHSMGGDLYVKKSTLEFNASARGDDLLDIGFKCARIGNSSLQFVGGVFRGTQLLVGGELIHVFADPATQKSKPVPQALRDVIEGFEKGEPMLRIEMGNWSQMGEAARKLRQAAFIDEMGLGPYILADAQDEAAVHAVAWNRLGMPVGCARLVQLSSGLTQIGRMATHRVLRSAGFGRQMLQHLSKASRERGDQELRLYAQTGVEGFFAKQGFAKHGEPFAQMGLMRQEMRRSWDQISSSNG